MGPLNTEMWDNVARWMAWVLAVVVVGVTVAAIAEVPVAPQQPVGTFEEGHIRVYELGSQCWVVVSDGPMGKPIAAVACK